MIMKKQHKVFLILLFVVLALSLTGCRSLVDTSGQMIAGTMAAQLQTVHFNIPSSAVDAAIDYHTYLSKVYQKQEEIDAAKTEMATKALFGVEEDFYVCTAPSSYFFYITKLTGSYPNIVNCSRNELINLFNRNEVTFTQYGRMITNGDVSQKAVMRVDFTANDARSIAHTYNGYIAVAQIYGDYYLYLAGYANASQSQLKLCFDCVRSMS